MKFIAKILILPLAVVLIQACSDNSTGIGFSQAPPAFDTTQAVSKTVSDDGLITYVIEEGDGPFKVISRDQVNVFFTGRTTDGMIFDSSYRNGSIFPTTFQNLTPVNQGSGFQVSSTLIEGFRLGLLGMREGEKRTVVIPPALGYGDVRSGTNGFDLRNDTLIFDIELDEIIAP